MNKYFTLLLCCILLAGAARAQDVLYLKDGRTMEVKVKKITGSLVYYSAKPGAPQRYIGKNKVEKIVYERGREQVFKEPRNRKATLLDAHNIATLAPANILVMGNQVGFGIGLGYERYVGPSHRFSLTLGGYVGLTTDQTYAEDDYNYKPPYTDEVVAWVTPGARFHWLRPESKFDLATGLSVVIGNVNSRYYEYSYLSKQQQFLLTAITIDNDFTLVSRRKVVFGVHTAFGPVFGDYAKDGQWMVQIGIKAGRRF